MVSQLKIVKVGLALIFVGALVIVGDMALEYAKGQLK